MMMTFKRTTFSEVRKFITLLLLVMISLFAKAQTEFFFVPHTAGDNVRVDVIAYGFDDLISVQFSLHWDPAVLAFQSYDDIHPDIVATGESSYGISESNGEYVTFLYTGLAGLSLDDGASLFSIYFEKLTDAFSEIAVSSDLVVIEIANANSEILNPVFHSAYINSGSITGSVIFDENANCEVDGGEIGLANWKIRATGSGGVYYGLSRDNGSYAVYVPNGDYEVEVVPNNDYYEEGCIGATPVSIVNEGNAIVDFLPTQDVTCPYLEVDISTAILRRCFPGVYTVRYCNYGTADADSASVSITLDSLIAVDSTEIPILSQEGNTYIFDIGNVGIGDCGRFDIYYTIPCETVLGQALCAEAHIYPDSSCVVPNPNWSGAFIEINGKCENGKVNFRIENTGAGDMMNPGSYIIIEDGVLLLTEPVPFQLNSGEYIETEYDANGATFIAKANQVPYYPGHSMPIAAIEACGTDDNGNFSVGYITQFHEDDGEPFLSIDCQEVVGSFDSNHKRGYPKGYGDHHYIDRGQDLEYLIEFQNTGTDTAFNVVVKDVIDPSLDRSSIIFESGSHPYEADFFGDTLLIRFDDIFLPDSNANEPASHGFVKFKISQKEDLPLGTIIQNEAVIYFDFNAPVTTNMTIHEIGENYLVLEIAEPYLKKLEITAFPNPFSGFTNVDLEGVEFKQGQWVLYDIFGRQMKVGTFHEKTFQIPAGGLVSGTYLIEVALDGNTAGTGKLMIR